MEIDNDIKVNLASFSTGNFDKGAGTMKTVLWFFVNALFVRASWNPFMGIKIWLLRCFGATSSSSRLGTSPLAITCGWANTAG